MRLRIFERVKILQSTHFPRLYDVFCSAIHDDELRGDAVEGAVVHIRLTIPLLYRIRNGDRYRHSYPCQIHSNRNREALSVVPNYTSDSRNGQNRELGLDLRGEERREMKVR